MMDQYITGDVKAIQTMLTVFLEMLDTDNTDTMVHAFDIMMNLSIHAHLAEDIRIPFHDEIVNTPKQQNTKIIGMKRVRFCCDCLMCD